MTVTYERKIFCGRSPTGSGWKFIELDDALFEPDAIGRIPEKAARSLTAIPIKMHDSTVVVAVADPFDPESHRRP